jgi:hypothetical protein
LDREGRLGKKKANPFEDKGEKRKAAEKWKGQIILLLLHDFCLFGFLLLLLVFIPLNRVLLCSPSWLELTIPLPPKC